MSGKQRPKTKPRVTATRPAGPEHAVLTVQGGGGNWQRKPCAECPWRVENTGSFPPEAFRHSANTAYDMAEESFACHMTGAKKPAACAGFLLQGATHNLGIRLRLALGEIRPEELQRDGAELHAGYRTMAVANGVPLDDPALARCRASPDEEEGQGVGPASPAPDRR